jgi:hypothetical protein
MASHGGAVTPRQSRKSYNITNPTSTMEMTFIIFLIKITPLVCISQFYMCTYKG